MTNEKRERDEKEAIRIYRRVEKLTGWRDAKIRFWLDQSNVLLGNVTPAWLIIHGKVAILDKMLDEAEYHNTMYRAQYGSGKQGVTGNPF